MTGILILVWALGLMLALLVGPRLRALWIWLTVIATSAGLAVAVLILTGGPDWAWRSEFALSGERLHLRFDGISALFFVLLNVLGCAGAIYSHSYWPDADYPQSAPRNRFWWSSMLLSMGAVLLSSNGLHFLFAWEIFAISSYFLITLERGQKGVRAAGWLY